MKRQQLWQGDDISGTQSGIGEVLWLHPGRLDRGHLLFTREEAQAVHVSGDAQSPEREAVQAACKAAPGRARLVAEMTTRRMRQHQPAIPHTLGIRLGTVAEKSACGGFSLVPVFPLFCLTVSFSLWLDQHEKSGLNSL